MPKTCCPIDRTEFLDKMVVNDRGNEDNPNYSIKFFQSPFIIRVDIRQVSSLSK